MLAFIVQMADGCCHDDESGYDGRFQTPVLGLHVGISCLWFGPEHLVLMRIFGVYGFNVQTN